MIRVTIASSSNMSRQAAGVFFYSKSTKRYLYLLRSDFKSPTWSIPGGGIDKDETLLEGIERECWEEMEYSLAELKLIPIQKFVNNNFTYHTFFCEVEEDFIQKYQIIIKFQRINWYFKEVVIYLEIILVDDF